MAASDVSRRLRIAIQRAGITQEAVAAMVGVTHSAVSHWVNGVATPTLDNLRKAAAACDLSLEQLFQIDLDEVAEATG